MRIFHDADKACKMRFRDAIFRSMAASWAPKNPLVSHARVLILFTSSRSFGRSFVRRNDYEKSEAKKPRVSVYRND